MALRLLAFDPGGTTGFAALGPKGEVLYTAALLVDKLVGFVEFIRTLDCECIIEQGPQWGHHSPVTKRAEAVCRDAFPNATLVPPNQWKGHPATRSAKYRFSTRHEKDAAMLGRWFLATGERNEKNPAATNAAGPGRKRN